MSEEQQMVQTEEERIAAKKAAAPIERRAAINFWLLLGKPQINQEALSEWPKLMREAMGYMQIDDLEEFKKFLYWTLEENPKSAEYLRLARDPCRSLVKNIETLKRFYMAWLKKQEILARKGKPSKPVVVTSQPDPANENGLVAGYTEEQIAAHAEVCKNDPWVQANDSPAARRRPGFVKHLMETAPPKEVKAVKKVDGKALPKYRQESGKQGFLEKTDL